MASKKHSYIKNGLLSNNIELALFLRGEIVPSGTSMHTKIYSIGQH